MVSLGEGSGCDNSALRDSAALARFPIAISETNGRDYAFAVRSSDLRGSESIGTYIVLMEVPTVVEAFLARPEIAELLEPAIVGILNVVGGMFQMAMGDRSTRRREVSIYR